MRPYSLHPNILVFAWSIRRPSRRVVSAPRQRRGRAIPMATMSKGNSGWPVAAWVSTTPVTTTRRPSTTVRQSPATMTTSLPVLAARHRHAHQRVTVRRHRYLVQHRFRSVAGLDQSIGNRLRKPDGDRARRQKGLRVLPSGRRARSVERRIHDCRSAGRNEHAVGTGTRHARPAGRGSDGTGTAAAP